VVAGCSGYGDIMEPKNDGCRLVEVALGVNTSYTSRFT